MTDISVMPSPTMETSPFEGLIEATFVSDELYTNGSPNILAVPETKKFSSSVVLI